MAGKRLAGLALLAGLMALTAITAAQAQSYPNRPIRLINGFAAGGNADVVARLVGQKLSTSLGQPIVHESRVGAGTVIANGFVAKSDPDGYTLLLVSGAFPTTAATSKALTYDPVEDFTWISMVVSYPLAVVVRPDAPYKSVADLVAAAKAAPGKLSYPSPGNGSLVHLAAELFNASAKTEMLHVPYRGGAEPLTELIAGRMDVAFETLTFVSPQIQAGKVRPLAVTSREPVDLLPGVPTVAGTLPGFPTVAGTLPGYEAVSFIGIAAPKNLPADVAATLTKHLNTAVNDPEVKRRLQDLGGTSWAASGSQMKAFVGGEIDKWRALVASRKIGAP